MTKASSSIEVMRSHIVGPKRLMPLRLGGLPAPISGVRFVAALGAPRGPSRDASPVASGGGFRGCAPPVLGTARAWGIWRWSEPAPAAAESLAGASRLPGYVPAVNAVFCIAGPERITRPAKLATANHLLDLLLQRLGHVRLDHLCREISEFPIALQAEAVEEAPEN
jgi:hypothetical protein